MSDDESASIHAVELSPLWQLIHPYYNTEDSDSDDEEDEDADNNNNNFNEQKRDAANAKGKNESNASLYDAAAKHKRPADYIKLSKRASRLGKLIRMLAEIEPEEVQADEEPHNRDVVNDAEVDGEEELAQLVSEKDPVTGLTLLQWATLEGHFMLVQYLIKRLKRSAFAFPLDSKELIIYNKWKEMQAELPSSAAVMERRKVKEAARAARLANKAAALAALKINKEKNRGKRNNNNNNTSGQQEELEESEEEYDEDVDEDEEEEDEAEGNEELRMPEDIVYDALEEYIDEWGSDNVSVGVVKRIGELGCYFGHRLPDGSKHGIGLSLYPNGDCYTGEYCGNSRHGRGIYFYHSTHAFYCGEWEYNTRHGYGYMCYPDGSHYLGYWHKDSKHGAGQYVYVDGSAYIGNWTHNMQHGHGRYVYTDGSTHTGAFYNNKFITGEWHLADTKTKYVGTFDEHSKPTGAGVFVHYGGPNHSPKFQEEGQYIHGKWYPSAFLHTLPSHLTNTHTTEQQPAHGEFMEMEINVPQEVHPRRQVKLTISPHCKEVATVTMNDVTRIANFAPLLQWIQELPHVFDEIAREVSLQTPNNTQTLNKVQGHHTAKEASTTNNKMHLSKIEVVSFTYNSEQPDLLQEVQPKPLFIDHNGIRHRIYASHNVEGKTRNENEALEEEGILRFTHPLIRLMVVLALDESAHSTCAASSQLELFRHGGVVIVESHSNNGTESTQHKIMNQSAMCIQLPTVARSSTNKLQGTFISHLAPALRLSLQSSSSSSTIPLIASTCLNPRVSPATEEVWLYIQQCHPDCLINLHNTLETLNNVMQPTHSVKTNTLSSDHHQYVAIPLEQLASQTSMDAMTQLAITTYLEKKKNRLLPICTVDPQRPPTPVLPPTLPRPSLQPLYSAQALREAQERDEDNDLDESDDEVHRNDNNYNNENDEL